jgi:hypothetical protein
VLEPSLTRDEGNSYQELYGTCFQALSGAVPINLVTFYDDLGANYQWAVALPVQAISIDFCGVVCLLKCTVAVHRASQSDMLTKMVWQQCAVHALSRCVVVVRPRAAWVPLPSVYQPATQAATACHSMQRLTSGVMFDLDWALTSPWAPLVQMPMG